MDIGKHEVLVRELTFPPRPEVVMVLSAEAVADEPDLPRICRVVKSDAALAGAMLKAANSPVWGRAQKISSVDRAIDLLGARNVKSIASGLVLRRAVGAPGAPSMERFWDSAEKIALIGAHVARGLRGINPDEAYTYGLFHDCGIPMLMQRFPAYREALVRANQNDELSFTACEEAGVGTNHAVVGYFLARSWHLPEELAKAILLHHELDIYTQPDIPASTLDFIAVGHVAEHVHHSMSRDTRDIEWERFGTPCLAHLGYSDEDFLDLVEAAQGATQAA